MPLSGKKRDRVAAGLTAALKRGVTKKRKMSLGKRLARLENAVSSDEKHLYQVSTFGSHYSCTNALPYGIMPRVGEGDTPQTRNGRSVYWQKGVCALKVHWPGVATSFEHPKPVRVIIGIKLVDGTPKTTNDVGEAQQILKQLFDQTIDFSSSFPNTRQLMAVKNVGDNKRAHYVILKDVLILPMRHGSFDVFYKGGAADHDRYPPMEQHRLITWSAKNHEAIFAGSDVDRPKERELFMVAFTDQAVEVQISADFRQFFTETKVVS